MAQSKPTSSPLTEVLGTINNFMELLGSVAGRDKLVKFLQYGAKIVNHHISIRPDMENHKYWLDYVTRFEGGVASARKVFRFFRFVPGYVALVSFIRKHHAAKTSAITWPVFLEIMDLLNKLFMAHYFFFDHFAWAAKLNLFSGVPLAQTSKALTVGGAEQDKIASNRLSLHAKHILNNERLAQYSLWSTYCWFWNLVITIFLDSLKFGKGFQSELKALTELNSIVQSNAAAQFSTSLEKDDEAEKAKKLRTDINAIKSERNKLALAFVKNFSDLGVAIALAGWWNASKQQVGILGVISAVIGAYELWPSKK